MLLRSIDAKGRGFNPLSGTAVTDAIVNITSVEYNRRELRDIRIRGNLSNAGDLELAASSSNPGLDFDLNGTGTIHTDDYTFDIAANLRDVDLQGIGLSDSICSGSGQLYVKGNARPGKWVYDIDADVAALEWNLPGNYIHLPDGVQVRLAADSIRTMASVNSQLTSLDFNSPTGLERLVKSFTGVAGMVSRQMEAKSLAIDSINEALPPFTLNVNASGRGLIDQIGRAHV